MSVWVDRATLEPGDTPIVGIPLTPRVTLRTEQDSGGRNNNGVHGNNGLGLNSNYKKNNDTYYY